MRVSPFRFLFIPLIIIIFIFASNFLMAQDDIIQKGVVVLSSKQNEDGTWDGGLYPIAISSLAGLAILGSGLGTSSPYHENLEKLKKYLLENQGIHGGFLVSDRNSMYGHGFATLFLSQFYGMAEDNEDMTSSLHEAARFICENQSSRGGWYYEPGFKDDEGSVTIVQIQALRSCRDVMIEVPASTIRKAVDYVKSSMNSDGSVRYSPSHKIDSTTAALTAAGISVLFGCGDYDFDKTKEKAFDYLNEELWQDNKEVRKKYCDPFENTDLDFKKYFERVKPDVISLLKHELKYAWVSNTYDFYNIAMSLLILESNLDYLPMFEN
ncbi:MAG: terpene cyclase/mutase family protein [Deltaproteobacteria bacterium]|nr:terpene cyclase/mutase family protein [Deltaproteobacteria bacterium]